MKALHVLAIALLAIIIAGCSSAVVERGDNVLVTYTGKFQNGTIFDTNDPANKGVFDAPADHFVSFPVLVGASQVVPGFENALLGMKEGETKTVTISARDAYGGYDPAKTAKIPITVYYPLEPVLDRTVPVDKAQFLEQTNNASIIVGTVFDTENFRYNITSVNDTAVLLYMVGATHDPVLLEGQPWNSTLKSKNATHFVYTSTVVPGKVFDTSLGPYEVAVNNSLIVLTSKLVVGADIASGDNVGRVTKGSDQFYIIDFNPPLAGLPLTFTIKITSVQKKK